VTGACAYLGYRLTRLVEDTAGVDGGRTTATLVVLVISLWTLMVLARPLAGWKLALVATMAGAVALIVAIPPLGHGVFLLNMTTDRLLLALAVGAAGAALVEITHRFVRAAVATD